MKKQHFKINLKPVTEEELKQAPVIVNKVYNAIKNKESVSMEEKRIAIKYEDFFEVQKVSMPKFSNAFRRISSIKQAISIDTKKHKKLAKRPGVIQFDAVVGKEGAQELIRLLNQ